MKNAHPYESTEVDAAGGLSLQPDVCAALLSEIDEAVLVVDRHGIVTYLNESASALFDRSRSRVIGRHVDDLVKDGLKRSEAWSLRKALLSEGQWSGEAAIAPQGGAERCLSITARLVNEDDLDAGAVVVMRDLTVSKQQDARLAHRLRVEEALVNASRLLVSSGEVDLEEILRIIGEAVRAACVYLVTIPPDADALVDLGDGSEIHLGLTVWRREAGARDGARDLEASLKPELQELLRSLEEPTPYPKPLESASPASAVPILSSEDQLYGYLGIEHSQGPHDWQEEDFRLLHVVGDMLSTYFERNMAEEALRDSEERWRRLVVSHPEPILLVRDARIVYINAAGARVFGADAPENVVGRPLFDFVSAELHSLIEQRQEALMRGEATDPLQYEIIRLDGEERIVESFSVPVVYGGHPAAQTVMRDITERKKSEERYRTFVEAISEGIWHLELKRPTATTTLGHLQTSLIWKHGVLVECNDVMAAFLGAESPGDVVGRRPYELLPNDAMVQDFVDSGYRLRNREYSFRTGPDQRVRHFVVNAVGTVERGQLVRIWGSCIDVTDRVELERRMVAVLEEQQQRIGRDLHDGVGQLLTGVRMLSQNLAENYIDEDDPVKGQARKIVRFAEEASERVRDIYRGLTPVQLFQEGLAAALDELAHNTDALPNVDCTFERDGRVDVHGREKVLHLYRIAQEATNNALKHAAAAHIRIALERADDSVVLTVEDNGTGFRTENRDAKSLGLDSMYYRARSIHADFTIDSEPGEGTVIRCILPYEGSSGSDDDTTQPTE